MLHIDGDIIAYRVACAAATDDAGETRPVTGANVALVCATVNSFIARSILVHFAELSRYHVYLTGTTNFRDDIAVTALYKGFRKPKPDFLPAVRQHLIDNWGAVVYDGIEADDAIATGAVNDTDYPVICSVDKDFDQVAIERYNFVTGKTTYPTKDEAMKSLYKQILTGDATDNIIGVEDCGPVMASELIDGCRNELDMWLICVDQLGYARAYENARLCYLRRSVGDWFDPPVTEKFLMEEYA